MALQSRTARRMLGFALLFCLVVACVTVLLRGQAIWHGLVTNEGRIRQWVMYDQPVIGFITGLTMFTVISLVPGLPGKSLAVGWLFGFWRSLAIVNISLTVVALIEFAVTRFLLRDRVQARFGQHLARVNKALARNGGFYLFSARVAHVPFTPTNYLMGATSIRTIPFWWSTQLGLLPSNILFCYAGDQLPTLEDVGRLEVHELFSWELVLAFVLLAVVPWIGKALVKWWQKAGYEQPASP